MKELFKLLITDFQEREIPQLIEREYNIPYNSKKIISLIGIRRSGKTSILYNIIMKLRKTISNENIVYINFEDDRLLDVTVHDLDFLIQGYYELYPSKRDEKVYFFFDEIQNIDNWELFVRRIYDTLKVQIFITGSSSKLLSAEIATGLRGRTISFEIFPFSFKEVLQYKNIDVNLYSSKSLSYIKNVFDEYLKTGGFPECIGEDKYIRNKILSDYMNLVIYKDVIERHNIKNIDLLKHIIKYCFSNPGTLISMIKLYNYYKTTGLKVSKDSLFEYFSYLEEAYSVFKVPIYRDSLKEEMRNPKKIYIIDNAFKSLFDTSFSDDYSKLYENITFLHIRRQTSEIYYYKRNQEVDFYTVIDGKKILVNVSYDIRNPDTKKREISGLIEAMRDLKIKESYLITSEKESEETIEDMKIKIIPLFKFLLKECKY